MCGPAECVVGFSVSGQHNVAALCRKLSTEGELWGSNLTRRCIPLNFLRGWTRMRIVDSGRDVFLFGGMLIRCFVLYGNNVGGDRGPRRLEGHSTLWQYRPLREILLPKIRIMVVFERRNGF
jgi:hypothetical protein